MLGYQLRVLTTLHKLYRRTLRGSSSQVSSTDKVVLPLRPFAAVAFAALVALAPTAVAVDVEDPGAPGGGGPCYDQPCYELPPTSQDPLPRGADVTKASVGGECDEGSYALACETEDCVGTFWVHGPCQGTSTCALFARSVCVAGANQRKTIAFLNSGLDNGAVGQHVGRGLLPSQHVTTPGAGVGGDCADHDVMVSCNHHVASDDECIYVPGDPSDPFETSPCSTPTMHCSVSIDAAGGCLEARTVQNYEGLCQLAASQCTPVCRELREWSITTC